jgi:hypothetical protein
MKKIIVFTCALFPLIGHAKSSDWKLIYANFYPQDQAEKYVHKIYLDKASIKTLDGNIREFTTISTYPDGYLNQAKKVEKKKDEYANFTIKCSNATVVTDTYSLDARAGKTWSPIFTKMSVITNVADIPAMAFFDVCADRISQDFNNLIFQ